MKDGEGGRCKFCGRRRITCNFRTWLERSPLYRLHYWLEDHGR